MRRNATADCEIPRQNRTPAPPQGSCLCQSGEDRKNSEDSNPSRRACPPLSPWLNNFLQKKTGGAQLSGGPSSPARELLSFSGRSRHPLSFSVAGIRRCGWYGVTFSLQSKLSGRRSRFEDCAGEEDARVPAGEAMRKEIHLLG
ncbi:hypothetical protein FQA47_009724 [Oryzias melastigma]|uniref:Uncharacterized protein n=1 Tax=Oryzias melastigma TaxID=30732 RepID=A0A834C806_ORYME|nr:hypothetical protein FQA47_009724 [Oryzias melastigma]